MRKRTSITETTNRYNAAKKEVRAGVPVGEACRKNSLPTSAYYTRLKKETRLGAKPKKKRAKLIVHDLPEMLAPKSGASFLIYGRPDELAAFARSYA